MLSKDELTDIEINLCMNNKIPAETIMSLVIEVRKLQDDNRKLVLAGRLLAEEKGILDEMGNLI